MLIDRNTAQSTRPLCDTANKSSPFHSSLGFSRLHLPSQGPLEYFVHHNTLHSLEDHSFFEALGIAEKLYLAKTKKSLSWYQKQYRNGRINLSELESSAASHLEFRDLKFDEMGEALFWNRKHQPSLNSIDFKNFLSSVQFNHRELPKQFKRVSSFWNYSKNTLKSNPLAGDISSLLLKFFAAYFDKGVAYWKMEGRDRGLWASFKDYAVYLMPSGYHRQLQALLRQATTHDLAKFLDQGLAALCPNSDYHEIYLFQILYKIKGWAALTLSLESKSCYNPTSINSSFKEFAAILLICELAALKYLESKGVVDEFEIREIEEFNDNGFKRSFLDFIYAKLKVNTLDLKNRAKLTSFLEQMNEDVLFKIWHEAYESRLIQQTISVIETNKKSQKNVSEVQVVTCIDEREESTRRYFEEASEGVETYGYAGHFGLNILFKGLKNVHFRPLCPVPVDPEHYVWDEIENEPSPSRLMPIFKQILYYHTRLPLGGALVAVLSLPYSLCAFIVSIFFPLLAHRFKFSKSERRPPKLNYAHAPDRGFKGFTDGELAAVICSMLKTIGLTKDFAPTIFICAHGSESMNNPHEAAHDCGACGGGRGAPNARLFAIAGNKSAVRKRMQDFGITIPDTTIFVGGYHNTCSDEISIFDQDQIPADKLKMLKELTLKVSRCDAKERVRKFKDVPLSCSEEQAYQHVRARAFNYSQPRPEYGHATNAICIIGKRHLTKNAFFDRRAFLVSYDQKCDEDLEILKALVNTIIPVCAGINLEYYFSYVDREVFGCGVKQPHNVTSLMGVMNGYKSDLRLGLPWQMVEIHEPSRIIIVIEATVENFKKALASSSGSTKLVDNQWVRIVILTPESEFYLFYDRGFKKIKPSEVKDFSPSSQSIFRGKREILEFTKMVTK